MELLALIAGITACAFLVQSIRAKGTISQLKMELAARQNDLKLTEEESAALKRRLDQALIELDRFKDILDTEVEVARILDETKAERGQLLLLAKSKVDLAERRLKQAIADAEAQAAQILDT